MNGDRFWVVGEYGVPRDHLEPVIWSRVDKTKAGAMLDGREWREFPNAA